MSTVAVMAVIVMIPCSKVGMTNAATVAIRVMRLMMLRIVHRIGNINWVGGVVTVVMRMVMIMGVVMTLVVVTFLVVAVVHHYHIALLFAS